jgi:hypothetical protein
VLLLLLQEQRWIFFAPIPRELLGLHGGCSVGLDEGGRRGEVAAEAGGGNGGGIRLWTCAAARQTEIIKTFLKCFYTKTNHIL